jgi:hypothetical protein
MWMSPSALGRTSEILDHRVLMVETRSRLGVAFLASPLKWERTKVSGFRTANAFELVLDKTLTFPLSLPKREATRDARSRSKCLKLNIPTDR